MTNDPATPPGGGTVPGNPETRTSDRLQSMLAQAVEGQQHEQRELSGALIDMRNQLVRLGQEIVELRSVRVEGGGADPALINNLAVELREAVRFLSERLDGVTRMVAQRGEDLADIRGALSAVDAHLRSQIETLGVLSQGLQVLPSYGERVSSLHDAIGSVNSRIAALEASVAKAGDNSAVVARLSAVESAVTPLGEQLAQGGAATAEHGASLTELSTTLGKQAESLADLHGKVAEIAEGTQAALAVPPVFDETWVHGIEAKLSALAADVATLSGGDAVQQSEERLRAHIDDAVIALAEVLVRRRPLGGGEPVAPASDPGPTVVSAAPAPADDVDDDDDDDEPSVVDFSAAAYGDEDDDADEESDAYEDDHYDEDDEEEGHHAADDEDVDATNEFFSLFPDDRAHKSPDAEAPAHEPGAWTPELPAERAQGEAGPETVVPEDHKRRWFSR